MLPARWYLLLAIVGAWLAIIAHELPHFYGDFGDDYYTCFRIGYETVQAWQTAFTKWHVNAPYYFLISYLPIKLHYAIPACSDSRTIRVVCIPRHESNVIDVTSASVDVV